MRTTIETMGGRFFDYADPSPVQVDLSDLARSLSNTCRFRGFVRHFYSVAEHACLVRRLVIEAGYPELGLAALHHDSHEAYTGDVVTPLKASLGEGFPQLVERIDEAIARSIGLRDVGEFHHPAVKAADELALRIEASILKDSRGIAGAWPYRELPEMPSQWYPCWSPEKARTEFLSAHQDEVACRLELDAIALRWGGSE